MNKLNMFEKFSELSKKILLTSEEIALSMKSPTDTHHVLLALVSTPGTLAFEILKNYHLNQDQLKLVYSLQEQKLNSKIKIKVDLKDMLVSAVKLAVDYHHITVDCEHILLSILKNKTYSGYKLLQKVGVDPEKIKNQVEKLFKELTYMDEIIMDTGNEVLGLKTLSKNNHFKKLKTPAIDYFTTDLVKVAKSNKLDPLVGRETELNQIMQVLLRRNKNNPLLVGLPGVGKTALVEGLSALVAKNQAGIDFSKTKIYILDLALMVAGTTYRGQFEERLKKLIEELEILKNAIIFIDEIHTLIGTGSAEGSLDMANILKPVLSKKSFRIIGATTQEEYRKYIEKDAAFARRFQKITINEPNKNETFKILHILKNQYEKFHSIKINDEVINYVIEATDRYITDRYFPDKAIDIIDQTAASVRMNSGKKVVDPIYDCLERLDKSINNKIQAISKNNFILANKYSQQEKTIRRELFKIGRQDNKINFIGKINIEDCASTISKITNIPFEHILSLTNKQISQIDKNLKQKIIGQDNAIKIVSEAIWRSRTGVSNPNRPIGSFLFLGPTGVGKTELAKNLAFELYGSKESLIKFDMSEFMEKHTFSSLIGAPPGYVGYDDAGRLTEIIRQKPYSVILFDEIEKAHSDIFNLLLQVMEDGYLSDAKGNKINFKHSILIMTSNLGMKELTQEAAIGFAQTSRSKILAEKQNYSDLKNQVMKKVKEYFAPEFLNRLDKIIIFNPLGKREIEKIIELELKELETRLKYQKININISFPVIELLAEKGFDPEMGARPIKRAISDYLETALAKHLIKYPDQKSVRILRKKDNLFVSK